MKFALTTTLFSLFLAFPQAQDSPPYPQIDISIKNQEEIRAQAANLAADRDSILNDINKDSFTAEREQIDSIKDFLNSQLPLFKARVSSFSSPNIVKFTNFFKNDALLEIARLERELKAKQSARNVEIDALRAKVARINLQIKQLEEAHTIVTAEITRLRNAAERDSRRALYDDLHNQNSNPGNGSINPKSNVNINPKN